jgi:iron complex outermembrane recepter protein
MNLTTTRRHAALLGLGIAAQIALASSDPKKIEPVSLSPFVVNISGSEIGRYASLESISAGRVRTNIMDLSQSVSVITSDLIQDVAAGRVLDAAKYFSGVGESTLPTS